MQGQDISGAVAIPENGDDSRRPKLRKTRLNLDITQAQMAHRMGISRTTYNELENGKGLTANLARLISKQTGQTLGEVWDEFEELSQATVGGAQ